MLVCCFGDENLIRLFGQMFICETTLKSWHLKGTQSLAPEGSGLGSRLVEIQRHDVAFAVMHTDELDWMVDSILPEYKDDKKHVDPSQFHIGYFRAVKILDFSSTNTFDLENLVFNAEATNKIDVWLKRDYDTQRDRVLLLAVVDLSFADLRLPAVMGRAIVQPDGSHAIRCVLESGGRIEITFDANGNMGLTVSLPSSGLFATLLCAPFYSTYESDGEESSTEESSGEEAEGDASLDAGSDSASGEENEQVVSEDQSSEQVD